MRLFRKIVYLFFFQSIFVQPLQAEESSSFDVYPRAGVGLNWLAYTRLDDTELDAFYVTMNVGISLNYSQFYFDLNGELLGVDNVEKEGQITGVEREDITATIGYLPTHNTSVFFGYTAGETKDDFQGEFHDDRGFFVGAGYNILSDETNYSFTLAYADLDGEISVDEMPSENTKGETTGFSYGISMSGPFRETMGYIIAFRIRQYDYDVDGTNGETDKDITSLTLGLVF